MVQKTIGSEKLWEGTAHACKSLRFTDYVCFLNKSIKKRTALLISHCSSTSGYLGNADKFELKSSSDQEERK